MEHDEFGLRTSRRVRASDLRRATGVPGRTGGSVKYDVAHPSEECQATVVEQRKACTKGQPESAEAERQRQERTAGAAAAKRRQFVRQRRRERRCGKELVVLGARGIKEGRNGRRAREATSRRTSC